MASPPARSGGQAESNWTFTHCLFQETVDRPAHIAATARNISAGFEPDHELVANQTDLMMHNSKNNTA
jgi:hypothetical protein